LIKNWSRLVLALIVLPILVAVVAVLSTSSYLVVAVIFPLVLLALLLNYTPKPAIKFTFDGVNDVAYVGDEVSFRAKVRIEEGFGLFFIRLPAVDTFELVEEETNVHLVFKGFRKVEEREYEYKMKALRRGVFRFPPISYSYYPPLSFSRSERDEVPSNFSIKILPKIQLLKRSQVSLRALHEIPRTSRARLGPHSTDFVTIRDYTVGDPYKFITWKASSRATQDKLLINDYEREGLRTFLFVLDRGLSMRRGTLEENPLEYGIAFILSYSRILLDQGMNVGIWLEPASAQTHNDYVIPSSGSDHYQRIKEFLIATESYSSVGGEDSSGPLESSSGAKARSTLIARIVRESLPSVTLVTNFEKSNEYSVYNYVRWLQRAGASTVTVVDIIPYNIVSKYSLFPSSVSSSVNSRQAVATVGSSSSQNLNLLLKSVLVSTKKKDQYSILPKGVKVVPWDPTSEPVGRVVKMSLAVAGRGSRRRGTAR
jgi:uncharacterized protein (DUF58 family)